MDQAIRRGDIYWHALPFNGQAEFFDAPLFEYSAFFVHRVDDQFNLTHKRVASLVSCHCNHIQVSQHRNGNVHRLQHSDHPLHSPGPSG